MDGFARAIQASNLESPRVKTKGKRPDGSEWRAGGLIFRWGELLQNEYTATDRHHRLMWELVAIMMVGGLIVLVALLLWAESRLLD